MRLISYILHKRFYIPFNILLLLFFFIISYISDAFQHKSQVDVICTRTSTRILTPWTHAETLAAVLKESGLGEPLLTWIQSHLSDRYQWVNCFGVKSNLFLASSGSSHKGGHLSPLIFSVSIVFCTIVIRFAMPMT